MQPPRLQKETTMFRVISIRAFVAGLLATAALLLGGAAISARPAAAATKPTVVLVHGSFTDASSWSRVIPGLQKRGYPVIAAANPLRGIATDSTYLKNLLAQIKGPIVLVGHSYGGIVITNAATGNPNVKALVYVAAFAPAEGETGNQLIAHAPGSLLSPNALDVRTYVTPDGQLAPEVTAKPSKLRPIFAADLPASLTKIAAASQRPAALSTLSDPSGPPAWTTIPSWALVAGADKAIGAANERFMAKRIHAATVEAKGASHLVMLSQPETVVKLIADAAAGRR
jgi:pimeloyl-ACP methyl ester carboxylesterase